MAIVPLEKEIWRRMKKHSRQHVTTQRGRLPALLPQAKPLERPTLAYLKIYYHDILDRLRKQALDEWARESVQAGHAPNVQESRLITIATHCQRRYLVEQCHVKYLHPTAFKMAETLLVPDNSAPEFPTTPLWLHPLAPLFYRGEQVRAIFVYRPFDFAMYDQNPYLARLRPEERRWCRDFFVPFASRIEVALLSERTASEGSQQVRVVTHGLMDYSPTSSWKYGEVCPAGLCLYETLGDDQVRILCQDCAGELDYWSRWLKTMLWVVAGRFRRPQDQRVSEWYQEDLEGDDGGLISGRGDSGKKRTRFRGEIVRYDASYFRPTSRQRGTPLRETHQIVSPLELVDLDEVDLEQVLIWDFCDVEDFTRTLQAPKYYLDGQVPTDPEKLRRVKVRGKKEKRQLVNLETWKYREAHRAELRKQILVEALAFKT